MFLPAFFQTTPVQQQSSTTIDGALVILILAIGTAIPVILNGVIIPMGKALVTRFNTGTDKKVEELEVFKLIKEEVKRLQDMHTIDEQTMNTMRSQIVALQEDRLKDKQTIFEKDNEIKRLQDALQDCIEENVKNAV